MVFFDVACTVSILQFTEFCRIYIKEMRHILTVPEDVKERIFSMIPSHYKYKALTDTPRDNARESFKKYHCRCWLRLRLACRQWTSYLPIQTVHSCRLHTATSNLPSNAKYAYIKTSHIGIHSVLPPSLEVLVLEDCTLRDCVVLPPTLRELTILSHFTNIHAERVKLQKALTLRTSVGRNVTGYLGDTSVSIQVLSCVDSYNRSDLCVHAITNVDNELCDVTSPASVSPKTTMARNRRYYGGIRVIPLMKKITTLRIIETTEHIIFD